MHLRLLVPLLIRVLLSLSHVQLVECGTTGSRSSPSPVTQIYQYPDGTFIENLHVLPSGHILLSTFASGNLVSINPNTPNPVPNNVVKLGNTTGLTGIAEIPGTGGTLYAVTGGAHNPFGFEYGSMSLFVVLIVQVNGKPCGTVITKIPYPDTAMMNGLAAIPSNASTILSADSIGGRLLRINTITRKVDVAWTDPAIGTGGNMALPLGINGLKIVGNFLYFTNSAQGTFGRVKIDSAGNKVGPVQIISTLPSPPNMTYAFDDFDFDRCGNAYVALHDYDVVKITPGGSQAVIAGGVGAVPRFRSPTAVATSNDGNSIYVTTGGDFMATPPTGGQVFKVNLSLPNTC